MRKVFEPLLGNQYTATLEQFKKTQKIDTSSDRTVKTQISHTNTESSVNKVNFEIILLYLLMNIGLVNH